MDYLVRLEDLESSRRKARAHKEREDQTGHMQHTHSRLHVHSMQCIWSRQCRRTSQH